MFRGLPDVASIYKTDEHEIGRSILVLSFRLGAVRTGLFH